MSDVRFRDFTKKKKPLTFQVDDEIFEAVPKLTVGRIEKLVDTAENLSNNDLSLKDRLDMIDSVFRVLLRKESAVRFLRKFHETYNFDGDEDIDSDEEIDGFGIDQITEIMSWLIEEYSTYPTESSSLPSSGSENIGAGDDFTAGASEAEYTLSN